MSPGAAASAARANGRGRDKGAAAARGTTEDARRQAELGLHDVVDEVVRNVVVEPRRRIHHLGLFAGDLHDDGVPPLAGASKDNVHDETSG
jgi:hypothetical protein